MTELLFDNTMGYGTCQTDTGLKVKVLRAEGLYNLHIQRMGEFGFFVKENVKRLSTIQKYMDANNYRVKIVEV